MYKRYQENGYTTFVISRNMLNNESVKYLDNDDSSPDNLILDYRSQEIENKLRIEQTQRSGDFKFNYGAGYEFVKYNNSTTNKIFTSNGSEDIAYQSDFSMSKYNFFGQLSRKWMDNRLVLSLGLRADANSYSDAMSNPLDQLSPRFSLAFALNERFSFNFNTGIYYQLPPYTVLGYQEEGVFVNKANGIRYVRNDHLVAGLEFNTASSSKITLEAYYKNYHDYPFLLRDSLTLANLGGDFGVIGNEPAVPRSDGRSYGLELLFQQRLYQGFYGIASYTLGWSEFEDKNGNYVPSSWDARHITNLTLGKRFKGNWEVGIAWRFQSGLPYTPFDEFTSSLVSNWNRNGGGIRDYDLLNTQRSEASNTLDIRIDKKWFFRKFSLNLYLDIENITGNAVGQEALILDRPLDENGTPIGAGIIVNPADPVTDWRYQLKQINDGQGTLIPTLGVVIQI